MLDSGADKQVGCRDYSADDVLTTADALQRSRLQSLSVACGRVRLPKAYANVTLSVASMCDVNSTECQQAAQLVDNNSESSFALTNMQSIACRHSLQDGVLPDLQHDLADFMHTLLPVL